MKETSEDRSLELKENMAIPLVASAPTSKHRLINSAEPVINPEKMKRSNSCVESKNKCSVTSERLARLRKIVDNAVKEHKIFTIKGGWAVLRREFLKRNWIEKYEALNKTKTVINDDLTSNLPIKQDWESPTAYIEKCEKTIMSRMLQNFDVDFYWNMRKDQSDLAHRSNTYKIMNRFSKSLFASKEGLALLLQQAYWHTEPGVAAINFPRCYVLGFPDHYNNFVEDFRLTACMGLLKWLLHQYDTNDKYAIQSPEGAVPYSALQFAMQRCLEFIDSKKHLDLDKTYDRIWDHEWEQFITYYQKILHENALFLECKDFQLTVLYARSKNILLEMARYWPEINIDGMKNIWIMKPGNKCRGRGIQLVKSVKDVEKVISMKYVVQKYIEKPLLIYKTKFDIRQWFLVASVQPLTIWIYKENYLRFSSQIFALDNFHESLHLTNHAVQCKYTNVEQRNKALPQDNMWDCHTFQAYLKQIGFNEKWDDVILPGIREAIVCAMLASQEVMDRRPNTFELYGADFMISEDFRPWLIEINCSPDLSYSTSVTSRMCPQCLEDLLKVVIDKRRDPNADTGNFELLYRQNLPRTPPYLGMNLAVRGRKMFKTRTKLQKSQPKDKLKEMETHPPTLPPPPPSPQPFTFPKKLEGVTQAQMRSSIASKCLPKLALSSSSSPRSLSAYRGPIIEDLIDNINLALKSPRNDGVEFVVPVKPDSSIKKRSESSKQQQREKVVAMRKGRHNKVNNFNKINSSVCRKQNVKENIKCVDCRRDKDHLGLFNEWATKYKINEFSQLERNGVVWERETVSILKGKNILNNERNLEGGNNKICCK